MEHGQQKEKSEKIEQKKKQEKDEEMNQEMEKRDKLKEEVFLLLKANNKNKHQTSLKVIAAVRTSLHSAIKPGLEDVGAVFGVSIVEELHVLGQKDEILKHDQEEGPTQ